MIYAEVFIKGANALFTWHSNEPVNRGDRIEVLFRGKSKIGIVVGISTSKPDFKTQPIVRVIDTGFVPEASIDLAFKWSADYFCSINKILSLMIPTKFLTHESAVKPSVFIRRLPVEGAPTFRGVKPKMLYESLSENWQNIDNLDPRPTKSTIESLVKKGLIECASEVVPADHNPPEINLNHEQQKAYEMVLAHENPTLIWGVTGSGKTEVYKALAKESVLEEGQVLILVPEIGLTPQLINHFKLLFGDSVAVWHSNLSEGEKVKYWSDLVSGKTKVLVGARSAIFVPLPKLKMIVIDEEHEWTYKNEFAPRFWTHDIAQDLKDVYGSKLVLGSATPRVESFHKANTGVWNLATLKEKFHQSARSAIELVDLKNEITRGNYSPISQSLKNHISQTLKDKRQSVIFLNKRGYAAATMCKFCGHTFECDNCSANMKVHGTSQEKLVCHICHSLKFFPKTCPSCGNSDFKFQGWGTQQVEMALKESFPDARILRADSDSLGGKYEFEALIEKFHNHEADILLGTQMIAKGLDFEKVDLVGLILADVGLNLPDFRSEERVFQLLNQVAGRAGRRSKSGQVLIQTYEPDHPVFDFLVSNDIAGFIDAQMSSREQLLMPPFSTVIKCTFSHEGKAEAFKEAKDFYDQVKTLFPEDETYWAPAFFPRVHNKYWFHVFIKTQKRDSVLATLKSINTGKAKIDVDPASLL